MNRRCTNIRVDPAVTKEAKAWARAYPMTLGELVENALREYMSSHESPWKEREGKTDKPNTQS